MSEYPLVLVAAAILAYTVTGLLTPRAANLAVKLDILDRPGGRKKHARPIPRLGGIAIVVGIASGLLFYALFARESLPWIHSFGEFGILLAAVSIVFLAGLLDDLGGVPALQKLACQILAASLLVTLGEGWIFTRFALPGGAVLELGGLSAPLTVLWIVGICNAVNLIDGLDGLAAGVIAIVSGTLLAYGSMLGSTMVAAFMAGIMGASAGFLLHNRAPAKIFMGDAGSLTLGFLLGAISVRTAVKAPLAVAILVPVLALGVPAIDAMLVAATRLSRSRSSSLHGRLRRVFRADRNHLHHLMASVVREGRVVFAIYLLVALSAFASLSVAITRNVMLGLVLVAAEVVVVLLIRARGWQRRAREAALENLLREAATAVRDPEPATPDHEQIPQPAVRGERVDSYG